MAIEVEQHRYAFKPPADLSDFESIIFHGTARFQYNYLHDLESLYWILIFILVTKWPQSLPPSKEHHRSFSNIFLSGVEKRKKFLLCDDPDVITDIYMSAADELKDGWRRVFPWGRLLADQYRTAELEWPKIGKAFFPSLYLEVRGMVEGIKQAVQWEGNLVYSQAPKRKLSDDSGKDSSSVKRPKYERDL